MREAPRESYPEVSAYCFSDEPSGGVGGLEKLEKAGEGCVVI